MAFPPNLAPVSPGDPILAEDSNAIRQLLGREVTGPGVQRTSSGWHITQPPDTERRIWITNNSGAVVMEGEILGIDDVESRFNPQTTEGASRMRNQYDTALKGVAPTVADHLGKWVVPIKRLPAGASCECIAAGVAHVRVYVNATTDPYCDVIAAETVGSETCYLGTGSSGAQILWLDPAATAETIGWAIVRLGSPDPYMWCKLTDNLYECGQVAALVLIRGADGKYCETAQNVTITDPHNRVSAEALAEGTEGAMYIPAGWHVLAEMAESGTTNAPAILEAVVFAVGDCQCGSSSDSDSSDSDSSDSDSSVSQPSTSQGSGSSKSNAIVKCSWNGRKFGYTALATVESPNVPFLDWSVVTISKKETFVRIDPKFIEVCEPDTIEIFTSCEEPVLVGAKYAGRNRMMLKMKVDPDYPEVRVVWMAVGVRKGFKDWRFPNRTKKQFLQNEKFINSAYER